MAKSYKGKFIPKNQDKYIGDPSNIVWRSTWERSCFRWCDSNPDVVKWSSEETVIPYISPVDGKRHRYFIDLKIEFKGGKVLLIEIKPKYQTVAPNPEKFKKHKKAQERLLTEATTWAVNDAKWKAAKKYADNFGYKFCIFTEDTLHDMGIHINRGKQGTKLKKSQ